MTTCSNCGAPLREGAGFCSACGTAVNTAVFCSQCGTELSAGDKFCYACGAPVKAAAPKAAPAAREQPRRRGRPPKNAAPAPAEEVSMKDTYPSVLGFYESRYKAVSISDRAIVFSHGGSIYHLDKDLHMLSHDIGYGPFRVVQTKTGLRVLSEEYGDSGRTLELLEMDDGLKILSRRQVATLPGDDMPEECGYAMSEHYLFVVRYLPVENEDGDTIHQDITFTRLCLDSGEELVLSGNDVQVEGCPLSGCGQLLADSGTLYVYGDVQERDEDGDASYPSVLMAIDFDTGTFRPIWKSERRFRYRGRPQFFDFAKGIMWTYPREMEMKRRGWEKSPEKYLVPRKIGWNTPILANYKVWTLNDQTDWSRNFGYFDGEHAYFAPDYWHFYMVDAYGNISEDWNPTVHGRTETAVVWPQGGKVIADLLADYYYTAYPLESYACPTYKETQMLKAEEVPASDD